LPLWDGTAISLCNKTYITVFRISYFKVVIKTAPIKQTFNKSSDAIMGLLFLSLEQLTIETTLAMGGGGLCTTGADLGCLLDTED
jgi:hypothetical protein